MGNWVQILVVVLAIGGPAIGKILEALAKRKREREQLKERQAAEYEALRTGQPMPPVKGPGPTVAPAPVPAQQRMQELARKRQQQIEELRRRQQAARQGAQQRQAPRPAPPPQRAQPQVKRPSQPPRPQQPRPQVRAPAQPRPRPAGMPQPVRPAPRPAPVVPQTYESDTPATSIHELQVTPQVLHPSTEVAAAPVTILGKTMEARDWRRFIVARELLDPPLALRQSGQGPIG